MARVTVEDCILAVPNRFDLVILAGQRAKAIASGNPLTLDRDNDKDAVVALREIAERTVQVDQVKEETIQAFSKRHSYEMLETQTEEKTEASEQIEEAFEDAKQNIATMNKGKNLAGLSFVDENIEVED